MNRAANCVGWLLAFAVCFNLGCQPGPAPQAEPAHDHDHEHPLPTNYADAVEELRELTGEVSTALASNKLEEVDHALHEIPEIGDKLASLAKEAGVDEAGIEAIESAAEVLVSAMTKVHDGMDAHGTDGPQAFDYSTVEADVDSAMTTLSSYVPTEENAAATTNP